MLAHNLSIVTLPFFFGPGIRLFDQDIESTDAWESKALVHKLENIDIYSNSWGPGDMAWEVEGPGPLTTEAIKHGIEKVPLYLGLKFKYV